MQDDEPYGADIDGPSHDLGDEALDRGHGSGRGFPTYLCRRPDRGLDRHHGSGDGFPGT